MNDWAPRTNTGKTRFNRDKKKGESWIERRAEVRGKDYKCKETWAK